VQTASYNVSNFVPNRITIGGATLGVSGVGDVGLSIYNMSLPTIACGIKNVTYCSGGLRIKIDIGLGNFPTSNTPSVTVIPGVSFTSSINLVEFGIFFEVAQSCYKINSIDACSGNIIGVANQGVVKGYWGTISDAKFFDRNYAILYPADVGFVRFAQGTFNLKISLPLLPTVDLPFGIGIGIRANEGSLVGNNTPKTLSAPFPKTLCDGVKIGDFLATAIAACAASAQFDIQLTAPAIPAFVAATVSSVINTITSTIASTALGLVTPLLAPIIDPILSPILSATGTGMGEACVTVYGLGGCCYDVAIEKTVVPAIAPIGTNVVYTLQVKNQFNPTTGTTVKEVLPSGLSYISDDGNGAYSNVTGVWNIGNMAKAATATLRITAKTTQVGIITNMAQVLIGQIETDTTNNKADVCISVPYGLACNRTFTATASSGYTSYQWYKDGVAISGATANTYLINSAGQYNYTVNGNLLNASCPQKTCCPIVFIDNCVCPPTLCLPVSLMKVTN
jgi:uncharacterized repeat protein (TIGR01451 family)